MAQHDREVPQPEEVEGGVATEHRQIGDIQFGTLHILPTLLSTPNAHATFFVFAIASQKDEGTVGIIFRAGSRGQRGRRGC